MKADFQIERPINIAMNITEIEEKQYPSFKMDTKCKIPHPTGFFLYEAKDIWFGCNIWDLFNKNLSEVVHGDTKSARLEDMSESFIISVVTDKKSSYLFQLICYEPETGTGTSHLSYQIDIDDLSLIERSFLAFPAWW